MSSPALVDGPVQVFHGDAMDVLREMPDESVHMVLTSPPYWGLRDYGTASWAGGDDSCDHVKPHARRVAVNGQFLDARDGQPARDALQGDPYRDTCGKCGAKRVDSQLGLESSPDEYVENMVRLFREVRRVLRFDGCCFLNLGDSYASSMSPQRLRIREDVTRDDLAVIALELFGLRLDRDTETIQGPVSAVLREEVEGGSLRSRPNMASEGVEDQLSAPSRGISCSQSRSQSEDEGRGDPSARREMRLLRRDSDGVPDRGSHQRGWSSASETPDGSESVQFDHPISGYSQAGLSAGRVPSALHELQFRDRLLGLLSSYECPAAAVPDHLKKFFYPVGLKSKDLVLMPARVAMALQADGWYLRSDIIWAKPNPMPESITDRPTTSHEHVFLLTRSPRYFFDQEAVREDRSDSPGAQAWARIRDPGKNFVKAGQASVAVGGGIHTGGEDHGIAAGRNLRSVWQIATQPYSEAHFATFPEQLCMAPIKAGTSERGCCPDCGAPWRRVVERGDMAPEPTSRNPNKRLEPGQAGNIGAGNMGFRASRLSGQEIVRWKAEHPDRTTGWEPTCAHDREPVPCTVLDPFAGSGTTLAVARRLGRRAIGIELSQSYIDTLIRPRISGAALPLLEWLQEAGG